MVAGSQYMSSFVLFANYTYIKFFYFPLFTKCLNFRANLITDLTLFVICPF